MEVFRTVLNEVNLSNIGFIGPWFTWERVNLPGNNIRERLDWGVASDDWLLRFSKAKARHLQHSYSDHCLILMCTDEGTPI